jgi:hypothetical protein
MADVFAFRGRAYYGKPGWEFRPAEVQENFGGWRKAKSQDGKAVADWLVKNGFRMVYRSFSKGMEARDYKEWWAKVELVKQEGEVRPDQLRQLVFNGCVEVSAETDGDDAVQAAMEKLPPRDSGKEDRWGYVEWVCGCTYNPGIASRKEEGVSLCRNHC